MRSFKIKRSGIIPKLRVHGPNHCTTNTTECVNLPWECEIITSQLDKCGFISDSANIDKVFAELDITDLSCELLAEHYTRNVFALLNDPHFQVVQRVSVTLHPSRLSEISCEFNAGAR